MMPLSIPDSVIQPPWPAADIRGGRPFEISDVVVAVAPGMVSPRRPGYDPLLPATATTYLRANVSRCLLALCHRLNFTCSQHAPYEPDQSTRPYYRSLLISIGPRQSISPSPVVTHGPQKSSPCTNRSAQCAAVSKRAVAFSLTTAHILPRDFKAICNQGCNARYGQIVYAEGRMVMGYSCVLAGLCGRIAQGAGGRKVKKVTADPEWS